MRINALYLSWSPLFAIVSADLGGGAILIPRSTPRENATRDRVG